MCNFVMRKKDTEMESKLKMYVCVYIHKRRFGKLYNNCYHVNSHTLYVGL